MSLPFVWDIAPFGRNVVYTGDVGQNGASIEEAENILLEIQDFGKDYIC